MLVLPLTVPVLIFGVAASNAAIVGPVPFGTPFTILCALTLMSLGGRPVRRRRGAAAGNGVTRMAAVAAAHCVRSIATRD